MCDRCGRSIRVLFHRRGGKRRLVRTDIKYCSQKCRQLHHQQLRKAAPLRERHQATTPRGAPRRGGGGAF